MDTHNKIFEIIKNTKAYNLLKADNVEFISVSQKGKPDPVDQIADLVERTPDIISKIKDIFTKDKEENNG